MNANLQTIDAKRAELAAQADTIRARRAGLAEKLAQAQAQADKPSSAALQAQAALELALVEGDQDVIRDAQARASRAAHEVVLSTPKTMELQALEGAIATLDAKLATFAAQQAELNQAEREVLLARLDEMAQRLPGDLDQAARSLMGVYVRAAVLGQLAESVGGEAGRYGPPPMPLTVMNLGPDRMERLQQTVTPDSIAPSVRAELVAALRADGFKV